MIGEIKDIWNFDPITWMEIKTYIIPVAVIAAMIIVWIIISNHEHVFAMGSEPVPFSSGHPANGDASIFGPDGYHFANE